MSKRLTPIKYVGSKSGLAGHILMLTPPHHCYVEVFGGSGVILFSKPVSPVEVYNDFNGDLVNLFRIIRDRRAELFDLLQYTLYSREEWTNAVEIMRTGNYKDELHRAWATFTAYNQSMGGVVTDGRGGWGYGKTRCPAPDFTERVRLLENMQNRLRNVQIENLDFREVINKYDSPQTFFYLDPPYVKETRAEPSSYRHEMTELDHIDLVLALKDLQGKMILSGYDHPVYKPLSDMYYKYVIPVSSSIRADGKRVGREEVLWTSTQYTQLALDIG